LATAIRTRSFAFLVAFLGICMWTQEHWSRMLAISKRYGLRPASRQVSMKSGSWVRGVQEATMTRLSLCSFIFSRMRFCVSSEHV